MDMEITKTTGLKGEITIPGDKSISHRAIMLGALAEGTTEVTGFLMGKDCLSTIDCFRKMGIEIELTDKLVTIHGKGLYGLKKPSEILYAGNSGTTTRILSGILAGQNFTSVIDGDESIRRRPMKRIIDPLTLMGGKLVSISNNGCAPIQISGKHLKGIDYVNNFASAQVKSAVLFAGLYGDGPTRYTEPHLSRNHTEIMMKAFGADIETVNTTAIVKPGNTLKAHKVYVPGDISSAAYFIVAGIITPNSEILIKNVGMNPTRTGILTVCQRMGGHVEVLNEQEREGSRFADLLVKSSSLKGTVINNELIPALIDELPIIAVMAAFAQGETVIGDASELKVKESNRIKYMVDNLNAMGAHVTATEDGMIIKGGKPLHGAVIDSAQDHRIAMSMAIAGINAEGTTSIPRYQCVDISYPRFFQTLESLKQ